MLPNPFNEEVLEETEVMEYFDSDAVLSPVPSPNNSQESQTSYFGSQETVSTEFGTDSVGDSDFTDLVSDYDPSSAVQSQRSDGEPSFDEVFKTKRKILTGRRLEFEERLELMEYTLEDLELVCLSTRTYFMYH